MESIGLTLIIVACHAVFREGCTAPGLVELDSSREGGYSGEGHFYRNHVRAGVLRAAESPDCRLYFSGGQTQAKLPGRSEARSYWEVARDHDWWGHPEVEARASCEVFARDSFENLVYTMAMFQQDSGDLPKNVVFIGWAFKALRVDMHRSAIKWPRERFEYLGVHMPDDLDKAMEGEAAVLKAVEHDPYLMGPEFAAKREARNPFGLRHNYHGISPDLLNCLVET